MGPNEVVVSEVEGSPSPEVVGLLGERIGQPSEGLVFIRTVRFRRST